MAEKQLVQCPQCGGVRKAGRDCPRCRLNSVAGRPWWSWNQSIGDMWKPAMGWSIAYLAISLATGYWKVYFVIALVLLAFYLFIKKAVQ